MIRLATAFSGIGAVEQAFKQLGWEHEIVFACDNGERYLEQTQEELLDIIQKERAKTGKTTKEVVADLYDSLGYPNNVKASYFANYDITEDKWYEDVRFLDGRPFRGQVDIFVGGSPCQSFSTYGKKRGLEDTRGTLFYDYARLVSEIKPKVFIYENVRGLLSHDNGRTWSIIKEVFESLNYNVFYKVLDAQHYGLPQMRKRVFVVGINKELGVDNFEFPDRIPLTKSVSDYLDSDVPDEYYLPEKGFRWVTEWDRNQGKARVNRDIMGCQTAIQQINWSGDFRLEPPKPAHYNNPNIYIGHYQDKEAVARKLTPAECLKLMGFVDFKIVNEDKIMYRQSGNSIAVPVLKEILEQIIRFVPLDENYEK